MERKNLHLNLLLYSTSLSIFSFFTVKLIILVIKAIICYFFGIDYIITGFWVKAISPATSGLWNFASVYTIFSTELAIPILIFLISLYLYNRFKFFNQHETAFTVWLMFFSALSFFSAIVSGAVTYTNTFHLLNWFYLPNHLIMALALASPLLLLTLLYIGRARVLKLAPHTSWLLTEPARRRIHLFAFSIPLVLTAIPLYIIAGGHPNSYAAYESGLMIISAIAMLIYTPSPTYRKVEDDWIPLPLKKAMIAASIILIVGLIRWVL